MAFTLKSGDIAAASSRPWACPGTGRATGAGDERPPEPEGDPTMSDAVAPHLYLPPEAAVKGAHISGMEAYRKLAAEAEADYEGYWARLARELLSWKTPFTKVLNDTTPPFFKWFEDGTLNASYNCLDRQVEAGLGDKVALIFESDDAKVAKVTYRELLAQTCRLANALKAKGVRKGDRV